MFMLVTAGAYLDVVLLLLDGLPSPGGPHLQGAPLQF